MHIKKGDTVKILAGNSKNKTGKVLRVLPKTYRAIVEGFNIVTKHTKPSAGSPNGGIVKTEAPMHISNLMLVVNGTASRIGRKANENGKLQRFSKKSGEFIK
ncbi:MAG: 50S ribosomal protein L24 [Bacteroidia bacterium]|nr:50S ribosomal protein L24 [Bacteroidia bacterium]